MNKKSIAFFLSLLTVFLFLPIPTVLAVDPVVEECRTLLKNYSDEAWSAENMSESGPLIKICNEIKEILRRENSLLKINLQGGMIIIVGDVHNNLGSVLYSCRRFLDEYDADHRTTILFLGDYVDRGERAPGSDGQSGIKIVTLLFQLKKKLPDNVFLLRGNHEIDWVNRNRALYGDSCLFSQCELSYRSDGKLLFDAINEAFECLSLAAVVDNHIFCVHGGIGPDLTLDKINDIKKPIKLERPSAERFFGDLITWMLWSDPFREKHCGYYYHPHGMYPSSADDPKMWPFNVVRGAGVIYGRAHVKDFYKRNSGLNCIIRAHEFSPFGYERLCGTVHSIFSAFKYDELGLSEACILIYDSKEKTSCKLEKIEQCDQLSDYFPEPNLTPPTIIGD